MSGFPEPRRYVDVRAVSRPIGISPDEAKVKDDKIEFPSARDLLAKDIPPLRWMVPGLLPEGLVALIGRPKIGKSWLALDCALAIALGTEAFGRIKIPERRTCLYMALEDSEGRLQRRLVALGALQAERALANLKYTLTMPELDKGGLEMIYRALRSYGDLGYVVVDMYGRVTPEKRHARLHTADVKAMSPLADMSREFRTCIKLLHHDTKAAVDAEGHFVDLASGSRGFSGTADQIMLLTSRGKKMKGATALLHSTGRDVVEQTIHMQKAGVTWTMLHDLDVELPTAGREQEVYMYLVDHPGSRPFEVAKALQISKEHARHLLFTMARKESVYSSGRQYFPIIP